MSAEGPVLHVGRRFRVDDPAQQIEWLSRYNLAR